MTILIESWYICQVVLNVKCVLETREREGSIVSARNASVDYCSVVLCVPPSLPLSMSLARDNAKQSIDSLPIKFHFLGLLSAPIIRSEYQSVRRAFVYGRMTYLSYRHRLRSDWRSGGLSTPHARFQIIVNQTCLENFISNWLSNGNFRRGDREERTWNAQDPDKEKVAEAEQAKRVRLFYLLFLFVAW